jgi:hypothetical protein
MLRIEIEASYDLDEDETIEGLKDEIRSRIGFTGAIVESIEVYEE